MATATRKTTLTRIPVLPLRGMMVFPHMVLHFDVGRAKSIAALEKAMMDDQKIFLVAQKDTEVEDPAAKDLYKVGTIAQVKQVLNLPGDNIRVLVEGEQLPGIVETFYAVTMARRFPNPLVRLLLQPAPRSGRV